MTFAYFLASKYEHFWWLFIIGLNAFKDTYSKIFCILKGWIFFFLLVLGNSGCLNKRDMKNVMHYVSSNSLRPHKKLWNQQKGHCLYWDVSFSQAEDIYSDYWIIQVVLSFQCTDQDIHSEATTQYRVHIIHRCILASSIILSKCTHPPSIHCFLL